MNDNILCCSEQSTMPEATKGAVRHKRYWGVLLMLFVVLMASSVLAAAAAPAGDSEPGMMAITPAVTPQLAFADLGDAPDSTNHPMVNMSAYGGVTATFPTVFDGPAPVGPLHRNIRVYYLGEDVSREAEADRGFDADGINNLRPLLDDSNNDRFDDAFPGLGPAQPPDCQVATVNYKVTVQGPGPYTAYVNMWYDANRNGTFGNILDCSGTLAPEWAVPNQQINLPGLGTYILTSPAFLLPNLGPNKPPMWMRITLSNQPAPANADDGHGPANGYALGETEDFLILGIGGPGHQD